jgi:hypothetical protein
MSDSLLPHTLAGGLAGAVDAFVTFPIDVCKTRQQLQKTYQQSFRQILKTVVEEQVPLCLHSRLLSLFLRALSTLCEG